MALPTTTMTTLEIRQLYILLITKSKSRALPVKDFSTMNVDSTRSNHCHKPPPNGKTTGAYHSSNHRLAIETTKWSTIPIQGEKKLCHFYSYNVVENEAHFEMKCPLYNITELAFFPCFKIYY